MRDHIKDIIGDTTWAQAEIAPIAGDMSVRNYARLRLGDDTAILMDSRSDIPSTRAFVRITGWLRGIGISAPAILDDWSDKGILILEDFGATLVTSLVSDEGRQEEILHLCIDLLLHIRAASPPPGLACPDAAELCRWTTLAHQYQSASKAALDRLRDRLETILANILPKTPTVSLRDFHVDNLMWLDARLDIAKLGVLDYQDAFLTHPVYDLVSLLTDARTDVSPGLRARCISHYAKLSGDDPKALGTAFAAFSMQRNLRILGVFARAATNGSHRHTPKMPRVHGYLMEALEHEVFEGLRDDVIDGLPAPSAMTS